MKVVGLTGGIGSGKTTIAKAFQKLDVPVYIADERSKYMLSNDLDIRHRVKELLGEKAYHQVDGVEVADRSFISAQVFKDKELLAALNGILHPAVHKDFEEYCLENRTQPYIIYEAAILFETGGDKKCDQTILVTASKNSRIERVMKRDGVTKDQVRSRMDHQWSQDKKLELADIVIINENIDLVASNVNNIHLFLLKNK